MVSKSDVKRFIIRPVGTVSKNFIGPLIILFNKLAWIVFDALTHLSMNEIDFEINCKFYQNTYYTQGAGSNFEYKDF